MAKKHGMYGTPTYSSWAAMHARCKGTASSPEHYVAKGIRVCDRWSDFGAFFADMGARPDGCTLDRFPDGGGNYEPGNCRWATRSQQSTNRSTTRFIEWNGLTLSTLEWSRRIGISNSTIRRRLLSGWPISEVLSPLDHHFRSGRWAHGPNPQGAKS